MRNSHHPSALCLLSTHRLAGGHTVRLSCKQTWRASVINCAARVWLCWWWWRCIYRCDAGRVLAKKKKKKKTKNERRGGNLLGIEYKEGTRGVLRDTRCRFAAR